MSSELKDQDLKTRFCPSPTGMMHLGNVRTALFNALLAKHAEGCFLLRIEDTDQTRSDTRYDDQLQQDLIWLGLPWQEGPGKHQGNGPYHQSKRQTIYDDYYQRLETAGAAYPCFCSEEDLALSRKVQRTSGKPPRYAGTCRKLSEAERKAKLDAGLQPTLRFSVSPDEKITFDDLVRGHQSFDSNDIGDFIIRRADGTPPFLFCNAVDDALMGVTHALRGEDHITNTPRQLLVLDALGLTGPTYGHIALIVGNDGSPLSKRHGSRSIDELNREGYLAIAIVNYIARLGHYYGHDHLISFAQLAEEFRIESLAKSPAKFNVEQLHYWQKAAVAALDKTGFWLWVGDALRSRVPEAHQDLFIETVQPNVCFPSDVTAWVDVLFDDQFELDAEQSAVVREAHPDYFSKAVGFVSENGANYAELIQFLKAELGVKGKALFMPLRVALTGEKQGPELEKMMRLMDAKEVQRRLAVCVTPSP